MKCRVIITPLLDRNYNEITNVDNAETDYPRLIKQTRIKQSVLFKSTLFSLEDYCQARTLPKTLQDFQVYK